MRKLGFLLLGSAFFAFSSHAQDKKSLDSVDKVIISTIIDPARQGTDNPDWERIHKSIREKYTEVQADRALTKAQIYSYYGKDWAKFSTAIVHYTEKYEDKNDGKLMNKNAKFILEHSSDPKEWKTAQNWVKHVLDKDPSNTEYKATYDALAAKMK